MNTQNADTGTRDENNDYRAAITDEVLNEDTFLRLTLSDRPKASDMLWSKVTVRPIEIKGSRHLQFSYFDGKKDTVKNFAADEASSNLAETLALPFRQLHAQFTNGDLHVRITKKGKALISRGKPSRSQHLPDLSHDRARSRPLSSEGSNDFLRAIGIMDASGKVRSGRRGKFRQINEFLKLMEQTVELDQFKGRTIQIVDCGCGNAYLTFAAYHHLNSTRELSAIVTGIDSNPEIIERCDALRDSLGWDGLDFQVSRIGEFAPSSPPDIVLSLHACDTATDEAIAKGILWGSGVILAAPCCQHELHSQIDNSQMRPIMRHGVLKQRTADVLTDAFRALALRIVGYRTDVVEFVSPEHTSKNLMIRASKGLASGDKARIQEYLELKNFWKVSPCIEGLIGSEFTKYLDD